MLFEVPEPADVSKADCPPTLSATLTRRGSFLNLRIQLHGACSQRKSDALGRVLHDFLAKERRSFQRIIGLRPEESPLPVPPQRR